MPRKSRSARKPPTAPVTVIGQFMQASLVGDTEPERYLLNHLDGPAGGPESAFWLATAELVARRHFGPDYDVRAVTSLAAEGKRYAAMSELQSFDLLEMEAVYRSALGEANIDLSDIKLVVLDKIRNFMVAFIILKEGWPESEIRDLMVEAERITFERGWHPPLAADVLDPG